MTINQVLALVVFNMRNYESISQGKYKNRLAYSFLLSIAAIMYPVLFSCFLVAKSVYDIVDSFIKFEASGVYTENIKNVLIDDVFNIVAVIILTSQWV